MESDSTETKHEHIHASDHAKRRKGRKISLYNGNEKLSDLGVPSTASNHEALKQTMHELNRSPVLTHAVFRDRKGKMWTIPRSISILKRIKIALLAD